MRATVCIVTLLVGTMLLAGGALAAPFTAELITIQEAVLPGESAQFGVRVTNVGEAADRYSLASDLFGFIPFIDKRPGELGPGDSGEFLFELSTRNSVNYGTHLVPVTVRSQTGGESQTLNALIFVRDPNAPEAQYRPSIALSVGAPDQIDPREDFIVNVHLRNRNARAYTSEDPVTVIIESDLFQDVFTMNLGGVGARGEKSTERRIDLDAYQTPGEHTLRVKILVDNETISEAERLFAVESYSVIEPTEFAEGGFFKYTDSYTVFNDGNVESVAQVLHDAPLWKRPFLSASHNYAVANGEMVIALTLAPQEEASITVTENYRLLVLLIILLIVSVIGYYVLRSPVILSKEASIMSTDDESSQLKVRLLVKNRSSKTMRNLRIIDRLSSMATVKKEVGLGTLKPTKVVKKANEGTLLRWDLDQLEPFEERIISYEASTALKLVGDVTLTSGKVKYDIPSGRERTSHSNEVSVGR